MPSIRTVAVNPDAPAHLALASVEAPVPLPGETLVRVHAISLNRGEVRGAQSAKPGARPGWDIAGVVEQPAADGTGPKTGDRVVGIMRTGAWAELVALPSVNLAVLPANVTFHQASTLPVAGLTALYALDRANGLTGRNVLVTGASGGVGHAGVQIAAAAGARVTGLLRQERHAGAVKEAGATHVVVDETGAAAKEYGPYDHILESVGGQVFGNCVAQLAMFGHLVSYGGSAGGTSTFDPTLVYRNRATISGLGVFQEMLRETPAVGLARLAAMVADGRLTPLIGIEADWSEIGPIAQMLLDRDYPGKAVLKVS